MAELYQLRGRVGRSNVQAYAMLIVPPITSLPKETIRRLEAMREFTELGAGFNLAMRDLEIRGAGNLLGGEQSGFITSMGFETYARTLEEAVEELKEQEFSDLFDMPKRTSPDDTIVEAEAETLIPEEYVRSSQERLEIYRKLYGVTSKEQIREVGEELRDRFGPIPDAARSLLEVLTLRLEAAQLGFRKIRISRQHLELTAPNDPVLWDEKKTNDFVLGIAGIRERQVGVRDSNGELVVRATLIPGPDPVSDAVTAFRTVVQPLNGTWKHPPICSRPDCCFYPNSFLWS
jgi:transcription-repair coupling factor (superfamily II helicase)